MLFSTGCSRSGIPPLSLRGLLGEYWSIISTHPELFPSFILQLQCSFYIILCCVAGCCSGGLRNPLPELVFHRREDSFSWDISKEGFWAHFRSLELGQPIPIIYSAVSVGNCVILEGNFRRGSCGSFGVFSCGWRVQSFIGGDLWGDIDQIYIISAFYFHEL